MALSLSRIYGFMVSASVFMNLNSCFNRILCSFCSLKTKYHKQMIQLDSLSGIYAGIISLYNAFS